MKLTRRQAIDKSIELWEWLAETGKEKKDYPWEGKVPTVECYLCEFTHGHREYVRALIETCRKCPYVEQYSRACQALDTTYYKWLDATTPKAGKKYAALFLEELKALREEK